MSGALATTTDRRTALAHFVLQMSPHDAELLRQALDQARPGLEEGSTVTVAAILLVYAASAGTIGSRLLGRARWALRAPLLGIVICLAAAWSVVAALGLAGLTLAVHATALGDGLSHLIGACVLRLRPMPTRRRAAPPWPGSASSSPGRMLARTVLTVATHLRAVRRQAVRRRANRSSGRAPGPGPGRHADRPRPAGRLLRGRATPTVT